MTKTVAKALADVHQHFIREFNNKQSLINKLQENYFNEAKSKNTKLTRVESDKLLDDRIEKIFNLANFSAGRDILEKKVESLTATERSKLGETLTA